MTRKGGIEGGGEGGWEGMKWDGGSWSGKGDDGEGAHVHVLMVGFSGLGSQGLS